MDRITATKEARIAALYKGGEWYVTLKGKLYNCVAADSYRNKKADGRVVEIFTPEKVRRTAPPSDSKSKRG
jgi:hypothetical protein